MIKGGMKSKVISSFHKKAFKASWSEVKVTQLCPTLCDPMDYTVHGILQARILQWVAFPFSRETSQPRNRSQVSHIAGGFFTSWAWTVKKAERRRIHAFELWRWRRLLRFPWTARRSNQSILKKSVLNIHWKDWCWSWNSNISTTWYEELMHWKRPWCWERLKVGGEGDDRGWDDWMASPTQGTWVWASSGSWWWTGRPGMLQSIGLQRFRRLNWTEWLN